MTTEELKERIRRFGIRILKMSDHLPKSYSALVISRQITRSASSAGANYREANRSRSKAEFKSKIRICESELSETQYWLEVINETGWLTASDIKAENDECGELLALFSTIARNC